MRDYVILTDSCVDLNAQEVRESGITVLPLTFTMDGVNRRDTPDHADMSPKEFYENIRAGKQCTTAAGNVEDYLEAMRPILDGGKDILCIAFSSALTDFSLPTSKCSSIVGKIVIPLNGITGRPSSASSPTWTISSISSIDSGSFSFKGARSGFAVVSSMSSVIFFS